jgi:hypothetical protein
MIRSAPFVLVVLVAILPSRARGQDADPIKARLEKAREAYEAEVGKLSNSLLDVLQQREDAARKSGDKKLVDRIREERNAFESRGQLPRSAATPAQLRELKQARSAMEAAYQAAVKEYTKAKKDDDASAVEQELKVFKGEAAAALTRPAASVALAPGTTWEGKKTYAPTRRKPGGALYPIKLTVKEVNGNQFKGELVVDERRTYQVAGKVLGNRVAFTSEKRGSFQQTFQGRIVKATMELTLTGYGTAGEVVTGTAVLSLKEE